MWFFREISSECFKQASDFKLRGARMNERTPEQRNGDGEGSCRYVCADVRRTGTWREINVGTLNTRQHIHNTPLHSLAFRDMSIPNTDNIARPRQPMYTTATATTYTTQQKTATTTTNRVTLHPTTNKPAAWCSSNTSVSRLYYYKLSAIRAFRCTFCASQKQHRRCCCCCWCACMQWRCSRRWRTKRTNERCNSNVNAMHILYIVLCVCCVYSVPSSFLLCRRCRRRRPASVLCSPPKADPARRASRYQRNWIHELHTEMHTQTKWSNITKKKQKQRVNSTVEWPAEQNTSIQEKTTV